MIAAILILIAAICKAFADTLDQHFDTSIFRNWSRKYFDPNITIKTAPKIFSFPLDGWHIANSGMIVCFICAVVFNDAVLKWYFQIPTWGFVFNISFSIFYNKIFR